MASTTGLKHQPESDQLMTLPIFHDPLQGSLPQVDDLLQYPQARRVSKTRRHAKPGERRVKKLQSQRQQALAQVVADIQALSVARSTRQQVSATGALR